MAASRVLRRVRAAVNSPARLPTSPVAFICRRVNTIVPSGNSLPLFAPIAVIVSTRVSPLNVSIMRYFAGGYGSGWRSSLVHVIVCVSASNVPSSSADVVLVRIDPDADVFAFLRIVAPGAVAAVLRVDREIVPDPAVAGHERVGLHAARPGRRSAGFLGRKLDRGVPDAFLELHDGEVRASREVGTARRRRGLRRVGGVRRSREQDQSAEQKVAHRGSPWIRS